MHSKIRDAHRSTSDVRYFHRARMLRTLHPKLEKIAMEETKFTAINVRKDFDYNGFSFFPGMVLCTGDSDYNNAMTIGSGSIGNFLGVDIPAVMVYVAPNRYSHELLEKYKRFTIMKIKNGKITGYLGWHSGRDGDKAKELGLHVAYTEHGTPYYKEAELVIECEMMTSFQIDPEKFRNDTPAGWYNDSDIIPKSMGGGKIVHLSNGYHTVYVGQVISALKKEK